MMSRPTRSPLHRRLGKPPRRYRRILGWAAVVLGVLALIAAAAPELRLFGTKPYVIFTPKRVHIPVAAVMLSGDIGFRGGMSVHLAKAMAERGMTVVGVSSPVVFGHHRTRNDAVELVSQAIRQAMNIGGAERVVLVGQSYGADIMATVLPHLAPDLIARVDAVALSVPGRDVYFRADPTGLEYLSTPDANPAQALRAFRGPPLICIYGSQETNSLCPLVEGSAKVIVLPGNHYLNHDRPRVIHTVMGALHGVIHAIRP